jgi:hypothetical protein
MFLVTAVRIKVPKMRTATSARRHHIAILGTESLTNTPTFVATIASHINICRLAAGTYFVEVQPTFAVSGTVVDEINPGKVV